MKRFFTTCLILMLSAICVPSQGATVLPTKVQDLIVSNGPWIDARAYSSLAAADAAAVAAGKKLLVSSTWNIQDNMSLGSVISVSKGGRFNIGSGKTLTVNGTIEAGLYQIVTGSGALSGLKTTYPEWFGTNAVPGTTDMTAAIQKAADALSPSGSLVLSDTYALTNLHLLNKTGLTVIGPGTLKSTNGTVPTIHLTGCQQVTLKDFTLYGTFQTQGPVGMEPSIRIDPNLAGATQVNKNIVLDNLIFRYNPLNAIYLGGDGTTYGTLSDIRITDCRMEQGLCFMLAVGVKNLMVDNINIVHSNTVPVNPGLAQDEDIAIFSNNTISCENISITNINIQGNGSTSNSYTGRPKLSFGISVAGLTMTNLLVRNVSVKDNVGNFIPSSGSVGSTLYVVDANEAKTGFHNAQFSDLAFYNAPGIFIEANNLQFSRVLMDTFPAIANFAGYGRAIDSSSATSTAGCKFTDIRIKNWNAGDPVIYTAEGKVTFRGLHIEGADGAVWAAPNSVYSEMILDNVGNSSNGAFFVQAAFSPFALSNPTFRNSPHTALKDNIYSRATGCVLSGARFVNNAVDTNVYEGNWMVYGIQAASTYADNAAALAGGLVAGNWYKTAAGLYRVVTAP